ncbi:YihY/virulence factor BrkB family protein [Sabulicella glaciei]|uniref:YihY/virulence factor BrkB family protein n=1 Tax=Sabulicella glaciei TaxID=2984948 RepID=A0ABT3NWI7_9PROT|nr:YihY/virulence factor BrkB family protein [Roseococcus sp. MDT2-1-1]MCW8086527.1 YihY/virulence factor BrkB family protein [Roseococcus sp. MDT2-1-1]
MLSRAFTIAKDTVTGFLADDCLTRGAGIAYFTLFSLGPLLYIATGIAGMIFGEEQVQRALASQMQDMLGQDAAGTVEQMADNALGDARGGWALLIGVVTLLLTASGAFGALQGALNAIWKTQAPDADTVTETITAFVRAKAAAMGLVATTAFLLLVSLAASAALSAFGDWVGSHIPWLEPVLWVANLVLSLAVITGLFAAIYKVLPDRSLHWHDVLVGAFVTAVFFTAGKTLIGLYIGASGAAQGYGAAGTLVVVLLWIYYSALIFLLGAEFTRAYSGKEEARPEAARARQEAEHAPPPPPRPEPLEAGSLVKTAAAAGALALLRRFVARSPARKET